MSPLRRLLAAAVLIAAALGLLIWPAAFTRPAAGATSTTATSRLVVIAAVPDLRWGDVASMPALQALIRAGSSGLLADKTAGGATGCVAGLVAVAAGTRTVGPAGEPAATCTPANPAALAEQNRQDRYAADVTALGTSLRRAGVQRIAVGAPAALTLTAAGPDGAPVVVPAPAGRAIRRERPDSLIHPAVVAAVQPALLQQPRPAARRTVDRWLRGIVAATPADAVLLVAGTSDAADGDVHLHVAVARGPGFPPGRPLVSATTGRSPYVELVDLAPTIATAVGATLPSTVIGSAITTAEGWAPGRSAMVDADRHAVAGSYAAIVVRTMAIALMVLTLLLAALSVRRSRLRPAAAVAGRVAAPIVLLSWLAQLIPWWRAGTAWLAAAVAAGGLLWALAVTVGRRIGLPAWIDLSAIPLAGVSLLVIDQLAGAPLQLAAPLGDDPLEAGRFAGAGNTDFAVLLGSALLVAGVAGGWLGDRRSRWPVAAGLLALAVVVDGAPQLGDDLGGLIAAAPAALVCLGVLAKARFKPRQVVGLAAAVIALGVGAALVDYARPAGQQTHLGHFVGQVLHGGAGTTLRRKLIATLQLQGELPLLLALVAWRLPIRWRAAAGRWLAATPGLPAAAAGVGVVGVLGALLNDSGVTVALFALVATVPSVIAYRLDAPPAELSAAERT